MRALDALAIEALRCSKLLTFGIFPSSTHVPEPSECWSLEAVKAKVGPKGAQQTRSKTTPLIGILHNLAVVLRHLKALRTTGPCVFHTMPARNNRQLRLNPGASRWRKCTLQHQNSIHSVQTLHQSISGTSFDTSVCSDALSRACRKSIAVSYRKMSNFAIANLCRTCSSQPLAATHSLGIH
jgi:hypothetical protein